MIESTDDVDIVSRHEEDFAEIAEDIGDEIEPPEADRVNGEFVVTAYAWHNFGIRIRTVTVGPDGSIDDDSEILVEDVHGHEAPSREEFAPSEGTPTSFG